MIPQKKTKSYKSFFSKGIFLCAILCSAIWTQSCSDEDEAPNIDSEITFSSITPDMKVWNKVPVSLQVTDDNGVASVEILVDGVVLTTLTALPFETTWDAANATEGNHTIKVIVTDKSGNKIEKETTVIVQNALVTITIVSDQLESSEYVERGFVFLSDENGNVIASTEYTNGNNVVLKSSSFNGTKFFLTEVLAGIHGNDEKEIRLWTFAEIERGQIWKVIDDREQYSEVYAGKANLTATNAASNFFYQAYSNGDETSFDNLNTSSSIRIFTTPSKLYVLRYSSLDYQAEPSFYGLFSNIVVGNNTINLNQVNQTLTKITGTLPEDATSAYVELKGYTAANTYTNHYRIGNFYINNDNKLNIYYPGTAFPSYYSEIGYETNDIDYHSGSNNSIFKITEIASTVSFAFANGKLTYSASGDSDFITTTFNTADESFWGLILPKGSNKVVPVLKVPDELKIFNLPVFGSPSHHTAYTFDEVDGYENLKKFVSSSPLGLTGLFIDGKNYTEITHWNESSSGGRSKSLKGKYSLRTSTK